MIRATTLHYMLYVCLYGRSSFKTRSGRMLLAISKLRPRDPIRVLKGGYTPYILRSKQDSSTFESISDAYIRGIMDGELGLDPSMFEPVTIE